MIYLNFLLLLVLPFQWAQSISISCSLLFFIFVLIAFAFHLLLTMTEILVFSTYHYGIVFKFQESFWSWELQILPNSAPALKSSIHEKGLAGHSPKYSEPKTCPKSCDRNLHIVARWCTVAYISFSLDEGSFYIVSIQNNCCVLLLLMVLV